MEIDKLGSRIFFFLNLVATDLQLPEGFSI